MKSAFLLAGLLALFLAFSGCVQQPELVFKYVCPDSTIVDSPASCKTVECMDCNQYCEDYCAGAGVVEEGVTVEKILTAVNAANYCEVDDDCVLVNTKCPLGCYNVVNAEALEGLNAMVKEFKQTCFQTCAALSGIKCVEGKCVPTLYGAG